jgi:hypothetical protein
LAICLLSGCGNGAPPRDVAAPGLRNLKAALEPPKTPPVFEDVTAASGVAFTYDNGETADHFTILESLGGGVGLIDYDQDGLLDIFLPGGGGFEGPDKKQVAGRPNRLYRNLGGWRFREVTKEAGLERPVFYSHGCAVADYDNDGWPDLLVTGYGRLALYRNRQGEGFEDVTKAAGLLDRRHLHWSTSAAWGDLSADGYPDLFIAHYVNWTFKTHVRCEGAGPQKADLCGPNAFTALPQQLYLSNGDGTFKDAPDEAAIRPGKGLGVLIADLDEDGKPDVYVANDLIENHLYHNQGAGRFDEVGRTRGVALSEVGFANGSMGIDAADYDGSGHFSLIVANYQQQPHDLYRNAGSGPFFHMSRRAGITAIGLNFVAFGIGFVDYDRDGAEDIFISNGHALRYPFPPATTAQRAVLLRNLRRKGQPPGDVRFHDVSGQGGGYFDGVHRGRGAAFGDLDNDGRVDVVLSHCNEPAALLRNVEPSGHRWLGVRLQGKTNRDAVGAVLKLEADGQTLTRCVKGGGSYLSANDPRIVFGLGKASAAGKLTVRWPSGKTQEYSGAELGIDRYVVLTEDDPAARPALTKAKP